MFKHAYCRGVTNALVQANHVAFPDEDTAAKCADFIAEGLQFEPLANGGVSSDVTAKIAGHVIDAAKWFKDNGHKTASFSKLGSLDDLSKLAHQHTLHLMQKAAEGSTIEGGDKGNKEPTTSEGKMDAAARPAGYAEDSRGKTEVDTRPGAVGKEEEHPNAPAESPSGDNSVKEQSRTASLASFLKKTAEGTTIHGGDKGNQEPTTAEGKMDLALRPHGYAVLPSQGDLGEMMKHFGGASAVGKELAHPVQPSRSVSGSNSVTETTGKHAQLSTDEQAYMTVFKKTAAEIGEYLPGGLSENTKIAHVRACMGMTTEERARYLTGLQKEAADKTAAAAPTATAPQAVHYNGRTANQAAKVAEMPDFIKEKIEAKKNGEGDEAKKDDDKKDDKDEKKEGSLADHLRRIASSIQPTV